MGSVPTEKINRNSSSKINNRYHEWTQRKKKTITVLLDFQAAFDTIWHKALIFKMHKMKFDNNIICLVKSYITNRKFAVKIDNEMSTKREICAGAPQGGILSAIFYLLYTNDFPESTNTQSTIKRIMFADDTAIYSTTNNIKQLKKDLNTYLQKVSNYIKCWKLKLNIKKTELIAIVGQCKDTNRSTRKNAQNIELTLDGTIIKTSKKVKYLGIILSSNLRFIDHIKHITYKVNAVKAQLKTAFNSKYLHTKVKSLMYKQLIRPIITYACTCWMQISSHQMEKLRIIERWYLRKITGLYKNKLTHKFINSKTLYEISKIDRIDQIMVNNNLKLINKINTNSNENIRNIANYDENNINAIKYKPIGYINYLNTKKRLTQDNKLLLFNTGYRDPNKFLYVTNQNDMII